jgi:hypothetical protein
MTLAGAPLTTLSAMSNGAIHFSGKDIFSFEIFILIIHSAPTATMLNANQLAQQYTTALACQMTNTTNPGATLLTTANGTQLHHPHTATTSPYFLLSTSATTSDEVCANAALGGTDLTGKTATLSSPSTLYFYNNNSTPTMYPTEFLRL